MEPGDIGGERHEHKKRMAQLRAQMRNAYGMAARADSEWNELNDAFKRKHRLEDARADAAGRMRKSDKNKRDDKSESYALSDAFAVQAWWRTQATYLATVILAEQTAYELLEANR